MDVLFVCTGNTCRSPMAACLFNARCAELGLPWHAESAGLFASEGAPASAGAFGAMKSRGLSLSRHAAQPLTAALARQARLIVGMSESHVRSIAERCPGANAVAFDPPVSDPFGGSPALYRAVADQLAGRMDWVLAELLACGTPQPGR